MWMLDGCGPHSRFHPSRLEESTVDPPNSSLQLLGSPEDLAYGSSGGVSLSESDMQAELPICCLFLQGKCQVHPLELPCVRFESTRPVVLHRVDAHSLIG
jgi:hypothetical protein